MSFSAWENVESGLAPGTVKGLLPIKNTATAFGYRKEIILQVFLDGSGGDAIAKDLKGKWQVQIRADSSRNPDGSYAGRILFDQVVTWTARIYAFNMGGFSLVTWQPLGDGGSGKQETAMVDGQVCATIADVNAASQEELEKFGETGAWRYLALGTPKSGATPQQKYNAEKGFTDFTSEGAATANGYHFFATWQSPFYKCVIPAGAILETVVDHWQTGQLTTEAFHSFSSQQISTSGALFDQSTGSHWRIFTDLESNQSGSGSTALSKVWRSRQLRSELYASQVDFEGEADTTGLGVVEKETRLQGLQLLKTDGGILIAIGSTGGTAAMLRVFLSNDQGEHWRRIMNQPVDITPLASCLDSSATQLTLYGVNGSGQAAYAILSFSKVQDENGLEKNGWIVSESGKVEKNGQIELPTEGIGSLNACSGGILRLAARDPSSIGKMILLMSRDGGKSYEQEKLT